MAEEALNLSLDDIIKRNADSSKQKRGGSGAAKRGGRGGQGSRNSSRVSSFQPRVQTRVVKTTRGRGAGRGSSRVPNVGISCVQAGSSALPWLCVVEPSNLRLRRRIACRQRETSSEMPLEILMPLKVQMPGVTTALPKFRQLCPQGELSSSASGRLQMAPSCKHANVQRASTSCSYYHVPDIVRLKIQPEPLNRGTDSQLHVRRPACEVQGPAHLTLPWHEQKV